MWAYTVDTYVGSSYTRRKKISGSVLMVLRAVQNTGLDRKHPPWFEQPQDKNILIIPSCRSIPICWICVVLLTTYIYGVCVQKDPDVQFMVVIINALRLRQKHPDDGVQSSRLLAQYFPSHYSMFSPTTIVCPGTGVASGRNGPTPACPGVSSRANFMPPLELVGLPWSGWRNILCCPR